MGHGSDLSMRSWLDLFIFFFFRVVPRSQIYRYEESQSQPEVEQSKADLNGELLKIPLECLHQLCALHCFLRSI